jgi:hypothetical protein
MSEQPPFDEDDAVDFDQPMPFMRWMVFAFAGLGLAVVVGLLVAIIGGASNSEGVSNFFRGLRDFFIVVLALQGILISIALVILIVQISALVNLLNNEIRPILEEAKDTIQTAKGTTKFVGDNVATPLIEARSAARGAMTFWRVLTDVRALSKTIKGHRE